MTYAIYEVISYITSYSCSIVSSFFGPDTSLGTAYVREFHAVSETVHGKITAKETNRMKFIVQLSLSGHESNNGEANRQHRYCENWHLKHQQILL
jgi:hypothetical protein